MALLWLYTGLALGNVVGHLADHGAVVTVTKPLLMSVLVVWLLTSAPQTPWSGWPRSGWRCPGGVTWR